MAEIEDDEDWAQVFIGEYAKSREGLEVRMKAERRANRTEKQRERARKVVPKKQVNFRASPQTKALMDQLCERLGKSQTDIVEQAIVELAAKQLPKEVKK